MATPSPLRLGVEATSLLGPQTGVGLFTRELVTRLAGEHGLETTALLVSLRGRASFRAELPAGVSARSVAAPARLAHRLWQRFDRPAVTGFDVVHGPNFVAPPAGGAAELVTIHDFGPWHNPDRVTVHARAYPRLVNRALDRGAHVHTVSAFVAGEAIEVLGVEPDRVHTIPNGFDPGPPGDPRRGLRLAGGPYVITIGTVEPRKDLPTLVRAMDQVWENLPELRLVVVGADGWGLDAFEAAVGRSSAAERIVRLGYVSDADRRDLLAGARCLAYPSLYEGFGLPPLEAMAQSTPVVTTTAGALPETCGDGALFIEPGDVDGLATAIVSVGGGIEETSERLVAKGLARIERFSWDRTVDRLVALYRSLASAS